MTDEINDDTFEPVGPANADIASPIDNFILMSREELKIGDLVKTKADGFYRVIEGNTHGWYNVQRVEEADIPVGEKATYLESYGIQVR